MEMRSEAGVEVRRSVLTILVLCSVLAAGFAPRGARATEASEDPFAELEFRHIGPIGNRASTVTGVPGDPKTYYAGAASGGIFKSADGGATWEPIFDDTPASKTERSQNFLKPDAFRCGVGRHNGSSLFCEVKDR